MRRDSFVSCASGGGQILGAGWRGSRSMRRCFSYYMLAGCRWKEVGWGEVYGGAGEGVVQRTLPAAFNLCQDLARRHILNPLRVIILRRLGAVHNPLHAVLCLSEPAVTNVLQNTPQL